MKISGNTKLTFDNLSATERKILTRELARGMSRREAITWMAAAGITAATAGNLFTQAGAVMAATPKKGGKVVYSADLHGPSDTLDPGLNTSNIDYVRGRSNYNSLCQINEDLTPRPELAEEFSANSNNTEWTFKIRKGVKFHDGSRFTADDVIYTMNRHYGDKSTSTAKTLVADVTEWKKVDQYTVKAILSGPNADLPVLLGTAQFKMIKNGTTDFQNPVGTGPFTLKEFNPGVRSLHVRNEDYWREGANVDLIEINAITDKVARTSALISGDIDMMMSLDPKAIKQIESADGVRVWSGSTGAYMGICCMLNQAPGNNRDFVLAMKYIQRRKKIVRSILKGQGSVGNDQPINSAYGIDYCSDLPIREHDLDKAKFHLKKSGITEAELHVAEVDTGITDVCLLAQREAQKIGLDLKIKKVPNDGYWGAVWMKSPMNVTSWNMRPTANAMLSIAFAPDAPWNDTLWKDKRMGKWLKEARAATDPAKRLELYCSMEKLINEDCGMIIMSHKNFVDAMSDKIRGITKMPLGNFGGYEWPEFVWRTDA